MITQVTQNPFRILGVYANSAMRDIVANEGKMKAFLKVGRAISYPLDLESILPAVVRNEQIVENAKSQIALPEDKFKHAQFWFVKGSDEDDAAFDKLFSGSIDKAIELWTQNNNAASYQNRLVCYLIKEDLDNALQMVSHLYEPIDAGWLSLVNLNCMELLKLVMGDDNNVNSAGVEMHVLNALTEHFGSEVVLKKMPDCILKDQLADSMSKNIISEINKHINTFSENKKQGSTESLNAGRQLMTTTKPLLIELKRFFSPTDSRYQMIADKLSMAILQCGIDYYNTSEDDDAATEAMKLQKYALSIAVGGLAKERCQENVNILQKIIANLPPKEVAAEAKAIKKELEKFCELPDKITYSVALLNAVKPYIQAIKNKLGSTNSFYLNISTQVVVNALHNVIEEVNSAMARVERSSQRRYVSSDVPDLVALLSLKDTLEAAWNATKLMDSFDLEADYKTRYNTNRSSLISLCSKVGVSTSSYTPTSRPTTQRPATTRPATAYSPSSSSSGSSSDDNDGCGVIALIVIAIACGIWGAFGDGHGFDFIGFLAGAGLGLIPGGIVMSFLSKK